VAVHGIKVQLEELLERVRIHTPVLADGGTKSSRYAQPSRF
jgi:hypothetical protein